MPPFTRISPATLTAVVIFASVAPSSAATTGPTSSPAEGAGSVDPKLSASVEAYVFGTEGASRAARADVASAGVRAVPALLTAIADPRSRAKYKPDAILEAPILRLRDAITPTTPPEVARALAPAFDRLARSPEPLPEWVRNKAIEATARCGGPEGVAILRDVYVDRSPTYSNFPDVAYELRRANRAGRLSDDERASAFDALIGPRGFRGDDVRDHADILVELDRARLAALASGNDWFRVDSPRLGDAAFLLVELRLPPPDGVAAIYEAIVERLRRADIGTPDWRLRSRMLVLLARAKHPDAARHVERALADHPTQRRPNGSPLGLYEFAPGIRAFEELHDVAVDTRLTLHARRRGVTVPAAALTCGRVFLLFMDVQVPDLGRVFAERDGPEMDACVAALREVGAAASANALQFAIDTVGPAGRAGSLEDRVKAVRAVWPKLAALNAMLQNPPEDLPVLVARYKAAHAAEIRAWDALRAQAAPTK